MLKNIILILSIFIFYPAFPLQASPATIKKVFGYIESRYADPVDPSSIYAKTLEQMQKNFPGKVRLQQMGNEKIRVSCGEQSADVQIFRLDHVSNVKQMENVIRICLPEDVLKSMRRSQMTDEEIVLDMLLGSLDSHSGFMNAEMYKMLNTGMQGRFGGIGAEITVKNSVITVVSPIDDTPAFMAGIKPGDQILKIDDVSTKGMTSWEAVKKIRGPENTKVVLTIMRKSWAKPKAITIERAIINIRTVKSELYDKNIGYIRISSFQEKTAEDMKAALGKLEQKAAPLKGLLLDMRNNPGGLLDQAIKVSDHFLQSGVIVSTRGRMKFLQSRSRARDQGNEPSYPIVVLINEGAASAAEIVAGALQDNGRAVVVGVRTFGKGSVQTLFPLDNGAAIKLTTAKYYTPNGKPVHENGITPDVTIGEKHGLTQKELQKFRQGDLEELKKAVKDKNSKDLEAEKEAQLQAGLQLLRKAIATGDLRKSVQEFKSTRAQ